MLITEDLFQEALVRPARPGATLCAVTGYASPSLAIEQLRAPIGTTVELIVGMAGVEGIQLAAHQQFQYFSDEIYTGQFTCRYVTENSPVHAKVYVWTDNGEPYQAFVGSANYTNRGFRGLNREVLCAADPTEALAFFRSIEPYTHDCRETDIGRILKLTAEPPRRMPDAPARETVELSLLTRSGQVAERSGLNWGQRPEAGREPNQAYLPVPASTGRSGFFPDRGVHFLVQTDDGKSFTCVRAQDNGKAIETPHDNSILGRYFRIRLGVPLGDPIRKIDLTRHGRTNVTFHKIDDDIFIMDVSS